MKIREIYGQTLSLCMAFSTALMLWKILILATEAENPITVVLTPSMVPTVNPGDLLLLTNNVNEPVRVGDIIVFRIDGREIPIVHRVVKVHEKENGEFKFLTKGDNNNVDDRSLYAPGQFWLERKDVIGKAKGYAPYIGYLTIWINENPFIKYGFLVVLGFFAISKRE